jgi:tetratricopeptide (TPR) repeat protein
MRWVVAVLVLLLLDSVTALAAKKKKPESEQKIEAKKESELAAIAYTLGRFEEALTRYEHAYELFQAPALLFNIGQCHRQLGRHDRAIYFLTVYLRENPRASNREQVEHMIAEEKELAQAAPPVAVQPATMAVGAPSSAPIMMQPIDATRSPSIASRWWFWTAIGGGLAVVGGAIAIIAVTTRPEVLPTGTVGTLDRRP